MEEELTLQGHKYYRSINFTEDHTGALLMALTDGDPDRNIIGTTFIKFPEFMGQAIRTHLKKDPNCLQVYRSGNRGVFFHERTPF